MQVQFRFSRSRAKFKGKKVNFSGAIKVSSVLVLSTTFGTQLSLGIVMMGEGKMSNGNMSRGEE